MDTLLNNFELKMSWDLNFAINLFFQWEKINFYTSKNKLQQYFLNLSINII